jgi:hypothetical protein
MLGDRLLPAFDELRVRPNCFLQDDARPHYALSVRHWLDEHFTDRWTGRRGPVE